MDIMEMGHDPFDDDIGHQNILAAGQAGHGKSVLATTMPGRVAYLLVESQAVDNIKQGIIKHGRAPGEIQIFEIRNVYEEGGKRLKKNRRGKELTAVQTVNDFLDGVARDPSRFDSVVIDSITALQELDKMWKGEGKRRLSQEDWGGVIDNVKETCLKCRDLRLHTMVIATTKVVQDDENRMHNHLSMFGKTLPMDLPRYFNLAVTMEKREARKGGRPDHVAITSAGREYITKGHLALEPEEVPDVRLWFDKMSKFWGKHGQNELPAEGAVTNTSAPEEEPEPQMSEEELEALISIPEIKELFDKLDTPHAKRLVGAQRYKTIEVLTAELHKAIKREENKVKGHKK